MKNRNKKQREAIEKSVEDSVQEQSVMQEKGAEDDAQQLQERVDALVAENEELNDKYVRKVAEFENYRRNMLKERAELIKNGGERVFVEMLPLIDDFERAKEAIEKSDDMAAIKEGLDLIYDKFISFLAKNGVKAIETDGQEFNTDFHEAVTMFPAPSEDQKNKIIDCISKGYVMNEKVIRFAKVVVGN